MSFSTAGGYDPAQIGPIPPVHEVDDLAAEPGEDVEESEDTAQDLAEGAETLAAIDDPANADAIERLRHSDS